MTDWAPVHAEARRILTLAWPVVVTSLNWTMLQVTDVALVGLVSTDQAAILGASRTIGFVAVVAGLGALTGILVFTSQADGAGDLRATGKLLHEGVVLAAVLSVIAGVPIYLFAEHLLAVVEVAPQLIVATAVLVRIFAVTLPFYLLTFAFSYFLEGISRPQRVTIVNLAILPLNAVLAWAFSGGHLGFAQQGAAGAALATLVAAALGTVGMMVAVWTLPDASGRGVRALGRLGMAPLRAGVGRLLLFGAMPALAAALEIAGFSLVIGLSTRLGDMVAHAYQIVFSIHNVTFAIAIGFGSAAGVRAGNAVGEGAPAAAGQRVAIALALALATTALVVLALMIGRPAVVRVFPATGEVHLLASAMLLLWAPFILFDSTQMVLVSALRSLDDQVMAGVNSIVAFFGVTGGAGWLLVHWGYGATGLVIASGAGMAAAAALHGARFWQVSARLRSKN